MAPTETGSQYVNWFRKKKQTHYLYSRTEMERKWVLGDITELPHPSALASRPIVGPSSQAPFATLCS